MHAANPTTTTATFKSLSQHHSRANSKSHTQLLETRRTQVDSDIDEPNRIHLTDLDSSNAIDQSNEEASHTRDLLLLRCRDAIENLHEELQDERT